MHGDDINAAGTTSRGAHLLRGFLRYAEFQRLDSVVANTGAATESPSEQDVIAELTRRGMRVVAQVGAAGYRIDIGVLDDEAAARFVCGIECDGVAYHCLSLILASNSLDFPRRMISVSRIGLA